MKKSYQKIDWYLDCIDMAILLIHQYESDVKILKSKEEHILYDGSSKNYKIIHYDNVIGALYRSIHAYLKILKRYSKNLLQVKDHLNSIKKDVDNEDLETVSEIIKEIKKLLIFLTTE